MARNIAIYHKCNALVSLKCDHIRSTLEIRTIHPSQVEARHMPVNLIYTVVGP